MSGLLKIKLNVVKFPLSFPPTVFALSSRFPPCVVVSFRRGNLLRLINFVFEFSFTSITPKLINSNFKTYNILFCDALYMQSQGVNFKDGRDFAFCLKSVGFPEICEQDSSCKKLHPTLLRVDPQ